MKAKGENFSTARSFLLSRSVEEDGLLLPIEWLDQGKVRFLDQTRLPQEEAWVETADYRVVAEAIRRLQVRGAPLIGVAAAYGLALAALEAPDGAVDEAARELAGTRPTAVNLRWALDRALRAVAGAKDAASARRLLVAAARRIHEEDIERNRSIGERGAELISAGASVLTHCNTGSLATGGYGTALGVIRSAWRQGRLRHVYATETRPLLQGARLTAWELMRDGIPFTLIADTAAGWLLSRGNVSAVITGADRIASNGDTANKIGTYQLAVLAREHGVPFYVAAPTSTIDLSTGSGADIPIEERSPEEVTTLAGRQVAPEGAPAANPAFDVTPAAYIAAIITESGVARQPYGESLKRLCEREAPAQPASTGRPLRPPSGGSGQALRRRSGQARG
jgi:methylthioribose-1-phosphate isomerase